MGAISFDVLLSFNCKTRVALFNVLLPIEFVHKWTQPFTWLFTFHGERFRRSLLRFPCHSSILSATAPLPLHCSCIFPSPFPLESRSHSHFTIKFHGAVWILASQTTAVGWGCSSTVALTWSSHNETRVVSHQRIVLIVSWLTDRCLFDRVPLQKKSNFCCRKVDTEFSIFHSLLWQSILIVLFASPLSFLCPEDWQHIGPTFVWRTIEGRKLNANFNAAKALMHAQRRERNDRNSLSKQTFKGGKLECREVGRINWSIAFWNNSINATIT